MPLSQPKWCPVRLAETQDHEGEVVNQRFALAVVVYEVENPLSQDLRRVAASVLHELLEPVHAEHLACLVGGFGKTIRVN